MNDSLTNRTATADDFEMLLNIRIRAMKPSLEKAGRFNEERAAERFKNSFIPGQTIIIRTKDEIIGFYMTTVSEKCIFLNHLYVDPVHHGKGIGTYMLNLVKRNAEEKMKPVELEALKESPANAFYAANGFIKTGESEFDNLYRWELI